MNAGFGIYIHWPYCARICPYCDFNVYRDRGQERAGLVTAIVADMRGHAERLGARRAETLFFGGGTPSLLSPDDIALLIEAARETFALPRDAEISLEANPEDRRRFAAFVTAGINRLSIGAQALDDDALKALGRIHDAAASRAAVEDAARTGARVSADFIYARAGQTLETWRDELDEALKLPAEHFSLYELTIKPGTAFERAVMRGTLAAPGDELAAQFYEITQDVCDAAGFPAYEISNHARRDGARARHNMIYWRGGEWLGLGPGAHGRVMMEGRRLATKAADTPGAYIAAINAKGVGWDSADALGAAEIVRETVIMGLRTSEGIPRRTPGLRADAVDTLTREGLIEAARDRVALTRAGRLLADRIAAELIA